MTLHDRASFPLSIDLALRWNLELAAVFKK